MREQNTYNGELQALMYTKTNWPTETTGTIEIDNTAVVLLKQTVERWRNREMKKYPQPTMTKLLKKIVQAKKNKNKGNIKIKKSERTLKGGRE